MVGFANSAYKVGRNEANTEAGGLSSSSFHYEDNLLSGAQGEDSDSYSEDSESPLPAAPIEDRYDDTSSSSFSVLTFYVSDLTSAR